MAVSCLRKAGVAVVLLLSPAPRRGERETSRELGAAGAHWGNHELGKARARRGRRHCGGQEGKEEEVVEKVEKEEEEMERGNGSESSTRELEMTRIGVCACNATADAGADVDVGADADAAIASSGPPRTRSFSGGGCGGSSGADAVGPPTVRVVLRTNESSATLSPVTSASNGYRKRVRREYEEGGLKKAKCAGVEEAKGEGGVVGDEEIAPLFFAEEETAQLFSADDEIAPFCSTEEEIASPFSAEGGVKRTACEQREDGKGRWKNARWHTQKEEKVRRPSSLRCL